MATIDISAGLLPPPQCYASEQDRLDAYAQALIGQIITSPEWSANTVAPASLGLYWLRLDANQNPVEVLKYNSTAPAGWARVATQFTYGVGGGVANAYTLTLTPASPGVNQAYRTGACYAFIASAANTGATTLAVDGLAAKAITKFGTVPLVANDIVANKMCVVVYDGTQFQLLNPGLNVSAAGFTPGTDRQFLRTNSTPATVWESGYITPVANYQAFPAAGGSVTFTHGFSVDPLSWDIGIICNDAGGDAGLARAIQVHLHGNLRLAGLANHLGRARHGLESFPGRQFAQGHLRPRPIVRDHLGRRQGAQASADLQGTPIGETVHHTGCVLVAGAGRVHDFFHGNRRNRDHFAVAEQEGAVLAPGHGGQAGAAAQAVEGDGEVVGLEQGQGLGLVGEEQVHL